MPHTNQDSQARRSRLRYTARAVAGTLVVTCAALGLSAGPAYAAPAAPVTPRAFTGGPSVALLWNPGAGTAPTQYRVYRNNSQIATVTPEPVVSGFPTTVRYIDRTAPIGQAVTYQVAGVDSAGAVGPKTSFPGSVTRPAASATVATPTVTVDASVPATYQQLFQTMKTLIEDWYPKFADRLVNGAYSTPTALTLAVSDTGNAGETSGTTITMGKGWLDERSRTDAGRAEFPGAFLHEMTHVIQVGYNCNYCTWAVEGVPVWATHNIYNDAAPHAQVSGTAEYFSRGYSEAETLLLYIISKTGKADFVRDLNIKAVTSKPADLDAFVVQQTATNGTAGKTPRDLYTEFRRKTESGFTPPQWYKSVKLATSGSPGQCIEVPYYDLKNWGARTGECWDTPVQAFLYWPSASGGGRYENMFAAYKCLSNEVHSSGSTLTLSACGSFDNDNQRWTVQNGNQLRNAAVGQCLQASPDPLNANRQVLALAGCSSSASGQQWTLQPM